jgi:hypothetical protein
MPGEAVRAINGVRVENYVRFDFLLDWFEVEYYFLVAVLVSNAHFTQNLAR